MVANEPLLQVLSVPLCSCLPVILCGYMGTHMFGLARLMLVTPGGRSFSVLSLLDCMVCPVQMAATASIQPIPIASQCTCLVFSCHINSLSGPIRAGVSAWLVRYMCFSHISLHRLSHLSACCQSQACKLQGGTRGI